jgi:uncharacterized protein YggE
MRANDLMTVCHAVVLLDGREAVKLINFLPLISGLMIAVFGLTAIVPRESDQVSVAAQEMTDDTTHGLTVLAMGQARGQPDQATLQLGVSSEHPTAAEALSQANASVQAVLTKLDELGIPRTQIQTSAVNLMPIRARPGQPPSPAAQSPADAQAQVTGYRATNVLTVRLTHLSRVGAVIDSSVAAGANQIMGVQFGLGDPGSLRMNVLQDAVQDARTKAQAIASPLGLQVGEVIDVQEVGGLGRPQPTATYQPAAASTPIEPGQLQIQAQVEVTFDISPASS